MMGTLEASGLSSSLGHQSHDLGRPKIQSQPNSLRLGQKVSCRGSPLFYRGDCISFCLLDCRGGAGFAFFNGFIWTSPKHSL